MKRDKQNKLTGALRELKIVYLVLTCCIMLSCSGYKAAYMKIKNAEGKKEFRNKKDLFKEYALCTCLLQSIDTDSNHNKDASKSVYYDLSDGALYVNNTGKSIDSNAAAFIYSKIHTTGITYENRKTPVLDCISYYKSVGLSRFIDSLLKTKK
jgi:hypothetical protein